MITALDPLACDEDLHVLSCSFQLPRNYSCPFGDLNIMFLLPATDYLLPPRCSKWKMPWASRQSEC